MKIRICPTVKHFFFASPQNGNPIEKSNHSELDLREEYANAFRTESYNVFWERVVALISNGKSLPQSSPPIGSTTADRLSSYRIFMEHLLDPDQSTVSRVLDLIHTRPKIHSLLSDYFSETANASLLCTHLLKYVDQTRIKYKSLKTTLDCLQLGRPDDQIPVMLDRLTEFSNSLNPFVPSGLTPNRIQDVQANCSSLLRRLERKRDKTRAKLRVIRKLKSGSAVVLVGLTASVTAIIAAHALAVLVAGPCLIAAASFELLASSNKLWAQSAQLDAAAKGTYILMRDLDTISRLVGRLNNELEHVHGIVQFWVERAEDRRQASTAVARQLKLNNDTSFNEQIDELGEHLYLCFMTVNRARNLVFKEMLNPITHVILSQVPNS